MLRNVFLAAAATLVLAGAATTAPVPAQAATTCKDTAKAKYPDTLKGLRDRHAYKKACKKAWKAANGKEGLLAKFKS
jgi:hypothetical protein